MKRYYLQLPVLYSFSGNYNDAYWNHSQNNEQEIFAVETKEQAEKKAKIIFLQYKEEKINLLNHMSLLEEKRSNLIETFPTEIRFIERTEILIKL